MRILKGLGVGLLVAVILPFAILEGIFRFMPVSSPPYLMPVSASAPVAHFQPNVDYTYSYGADFAIRTHKRSNNFGYNHFADYRPEARTPLLMVIGDSFVEAQAVNNGKSAAELLHTALGERGRVYSIAVSGAQLSEYLVFAQYAQKTFRPNAMAFCIISNDFDESLLKYKSEPRFHYFDDQARLQRIDYALSPSKQVLRHSAFLRYLMFNVSIEARIQALAGGARAPDPNLGVRDLDAPAVFEQRIRDSERAVDYFLERLPEMSGLERRALAFVLDAERPAIYSDAALKQTENSYHARMRRYFAAQALARGYEVIDLQPAFIRRHRESGARFEFPSDSHWNELGNRVVAEELAGSALFRRAFPAPEGLGPQAEARPGKL